MVEKRRCDWCGRDAKWYVIEKKPKQSSYMCDHHYNSHARSPLGKGIKLDKKKTL